MDALLRRQQELAEQRRRMGKTVANNVSITGQVDGDDYGDDLDEETGELSCGLLLVSAGCCCWTPFGTLCGSPTSSEATVCGRETRGCSLRAREQTATP